MDKLKLLSRSEESPRICIIGAGFSGICAGAQLVKKLKFTNFRIFDANSDFGGTWCANKYPGAACDIQSHLYSYSFEKNPKWSQNYASHEEIQAYLKRIAIKYGLHAKAKFNTKVNSLYWNEDQGYWEATTLDMSNQETEKHIFDIVISCMGAFHTPDIPEKYKDFRGTLMHSAEWSPSIDLDGKHVGVIGCGASAIQIIPEIAPKVGQLHSYQRKPAWIIPKVRFHFPEFVQTLFYIFPILMILLRWSNYLFNEFLFRAYRTGTIINRIGTFLILFYLWLKGPDDPEKRKGLTPNYNLGCKQVLVSNNYYQAFGRDNVHLHRSHIRKIDGNVIITEDGQRQKLDVLILATGFKVQETYVPVDIRGLNGITVQNLLDDPKTYKGIMHPKLPNFFFLLGPNTGLAHNSVVFMIESSMNFVGKVLKEFKGEHKASRVVVKEEAMEEWTEKLDEVMGRTVFGVGKGCGSWYANSKGRVTTLWPSFSFYYYFKTNKVDYNHLDFTY